MTEPNLHQALTCVDCQHRFWFTTGEQRFFAVRGLAAPKRCPACRRARRRRLEAIKETGHPSAERPVGPPDEHQVLRTRVSQSWR